MSNYSRVGIKELTDARLDANYYAPRFLENEKNLAQCGLPRKKIFEISELCNCGATPVDVAYSSDGVGLVRTSDVRPNHFKAEGVLRTNDLDLSDLRESVIARPGDLLYTMSGTIGYACVIPDDEMPVSFSNTVARVRLPKKSPYDAHYIAVFFNCHYGYEQSLRLVSGGIQGHVMPNPFKALLVALPNSVAQKYIGDKIRQAEQLRTWAKALSISVAAQFSDLVKNPLPAKVSWVAKKEDLDPYRINPKHYDPVVLDLIQRAKDECIRLDSLSALVGTRQIAGGATPKGAQYCDMGILFARVQNVKPLRLDLSDAVYIDQFADEELARSRCAAEDIILTITGYPGTASLVTEEDLPVNINQHSVRFNIKEGIEPGYVCAALNSKFLKYQVDRLAIGGTRDALDYPSVGRLLIPRSEAEVEKTIAEQARCVNAAIKLSQRLTSTAKLLVEDLIEGQITEAQLIAAEQALQNGNDTLDRKILGRLKTDGIDGEGAALFSDLDELYRLLALAEVE